MNDLYKYFEKNYTPTSLEKKILSNVEGNWAAISKIFCSDPITGRVTICRFGNFGRLIGKVQTSMSLFGPHPFVLNCTPKRKPFEFALEEKFFNDEYFSKSSRIRFRSA